MKQKNKEPQENIATQEKSKDNIFKNDIFKAILIATVTALLTQTLSFFFWTKQFYSNKAEKRLDLKIQAAENFVKNTSGFFQYITSNQTKIFATRLEGDKYIDSIKTKGIKVYDQLSPNQIVELNKKLDFSQQMTEDIKQLIVSRNTFDESLIKARLVFSPQIMLRIDSLKNFTSEDFIIAYYYNNIKGRVTFDTTTIFNESDKLTRKIVGYRNEILNDMINEINL